MLTALVVFLWLCAGGSVLNALTSRSGFVAVLNFVYAVAYVWAAILIGRLP